MNETGAAEQHVHNRLAGHAPLVAVVGDRIFPLEGPLTAPYPFVTYTQLPGPDRLTSGPRRLLVRPRFLVLAYINRRSSADAQALASLIDDALTGSTGNITLDGEEYHVQTVRREEPVLRLSAPDGQKYTSAGGYYRVPAYHR